MHFDEFKTKTILITGAGSGIGQAQAIAFAQQGAFVLGLDIQSAGLKDTEKQTALLQGQFVGFIVDITNSAALDKVIALIKKQFGPIHILLNTAGVLDNYAPTLDTSEALWDTIIGVNLKGTYLVTNRVLPQFIEAKQGVIINMSSIAGKVAGGGGAAYTASKHGIIGYTKQLDYDYAKKGIRANAIAPGAIKTAMTASDFIGDAKMAKWVASETPAGRWANPGEVASLTLFLASQQADYIHGTVLTIDGGWLEK